MRWDRIPESNDLCNFSSWWISAPCFWWGWVILKEEAHFYYWFCFWSYFNQTKNLKGTCSSGSGKPTNSPPFSAPVWSISSVSTSSSDSIWFSAYQSPGTSAWRTLLQPSYRLRKTRPFGMPVLVLHRCSKTTDYIRTVLWIFNRLTTSLNIL